MQIRSSSGNGQILEGVINKILVKNQIIATAKAVRDIAGEEGVKVVVAAGLIDAYESGVILEDNDIDFVVAKVYGGGKLEKTAQMGSALRGLGKGLGNLWQGVSNVGKGVVDKAKAVGKGIANLPQAMEQKGYQMQQNKFQQQTQTLQATTKAMSGQYQRLQETLGNLGRFTMNLQNNAIKGQVKPDVLNTAQGLIKSLQNQLATLNQGIVSLFKLQNMAAPQAKTTPQQAINQALPKAPAVQQTLSY